MYDRGFPNLVDYQAPVSICKLLVVAVLRHFHETWSSKLGNHIYCWDHFVSPCISMTVSCFIFFKSDEAIAFFLPFPAQVYKCT